MFIANFINYKHVGEHNEIFKLGILQEIAIEKIFLLLLSRYLIYLNAAYYNGIWDNFHSRNLKIKI